MTSREWPVIGCGVGLRTQHYPVILEEWPNMDWFEAISENYMDTGGRPLHILEKVRAHYPIALHGTSLSIGSTDPLSEGYLVRLKRLIEHIDPFIVSDHLCWCGVSGDALHDLLPLPFTEEALRHVVGRVNELQDFLGRKILLENVSTYVTYRHSTMPEWEFLTQIAKRSGSGILLDLNNLYVNSFNHQFDPHEYLKNIPGELVGQFHLAGHTDMGGYLFDTHSASVIDPVWDLYREALELYGPVSTLVEWDENIPPFPELVAEAERARKIYRGFESQKGTASMVSSKNGGSSKRLSNHPDIPLAKIQKWMKSKVQPASLNGNSKIGGSVLNPQGGVPGEERMDVYAKGYLARIRETLKEVYEAVFHVLGTERFDELCKAYANRFPSRNYNLNYAGLHLPELLENFPLTKEFPFLPDLAKFEWEVWGAFHSFDEIPMKVGQMKNISPDDWERMQIIFQPSVRLFDSAWPVLDIWLARHEETQIDFQNRPQQILIGRRDDQIRCELLDKNQHGLLQGLLVGKTLGEVCGELARTIEEEVPIADWFSHWVEDGLILRLSLDGAVIS